MNFSDPANRELIDKFVDVKLTITDSINSLTMNANRIILAYYSNFFRMLFSRDNSLEITIVVPNTIITKSIIDSFYGMTTQHDLSKWFVIFETIKCQNYLLLDTIDADLYDLVVPNNEFESLLNVLQLYDLSQHRRLIKTLKRNLPNNYDLKLFSKNLRKELRRKDYVLVAQVEDRIVIIDPLYNFVTKTQTIIKYDFDIMPDNSTLVSIDARRVNIWDLSNATLNLLSYIDKGWFSSCITCSPNNELVAIGSNVGAIDLYKFQPGKMDSPPILQSDRMFYPFYGKVSEVIFSPSGKIMVAHMVGRFFVWNMTTKKMIKNINQSFINIAFSYNDIKFAFISDKNIHIHNIDAHVCTNYDRCGITKIIFSPNDEDLIVLNDSNCVLKWNLSSNKLESFESHLFDDITKIVIAPNNEQLVASTKQGKIIVWDINTRQILNTFDSGMNIKKFVIINKN